MARAPTRSPSECSSNSSQHSRSPVHPSMSHSVPLHCNAFQSVSNTSWSLQRFTICLSKIQFKFWCIHTDERVCRVSLHRLHGVVILPVNKDTIAPTQTPYLVTPDLDKNYMYNGCFCGPYLYTRTNFFSGSWTSNLKTSVSEYFCYSLHSILHFPFHSRSSFSCNRVRTNTVTKWVVKEFDNILIPEEDHGLFYTQEAYVLSDYCGEGIRGAYSW